MATPAARTLQAVASSGLFLDFGPAEAVSVANRLSEGPTSEHPVHALRAALTEWSRTSGHALSPALLLVALSAASSHGVAAAAPGRSSSEDDMQVDTEEEEAEAAAGPDGGNPLAGKATPQIARYLVETFNEPEHQIAAFTRFAGQLGPAGTWEVLLEANRAVQEGAPISKCADGKPRTPGGVFIKLASAAKAQKRHAEVVACAPEFRLRPYQATAVDRIRKEGGNWVVQAATNAGKTAIFIEVAKLMLQNNPDAKTLVIVPTIALTVQHCAAFQKAGFVGPQLQPSAAGSPQPRQPSAAGSPSSSVPQRLGRVQWYCSDNPLQKDSWSFELSRHAVLVMEAASFKNLLDSGAARLKDLDLLVLDEVHHCDKDHPYARIMAEYDRDASKPQVLGFSASAVGGSTEAEVVANMAALRQRLGARLHVVPDEEVEAVAPAPDEEVQRVAAREDDGLVQAMLVQAMLAVALQLGTDMRRLGANSSVEAGSASSSGAAAGLADEGTRAEMQRCVVSLQQAVQTAARPGMAEDAFNQLCKWRNEAEDMAAAWDMANLGFGLHLMVVLRKCSGLAEDVGMECALQVLARQLLSLATGSAAGAAATGAASRAVPLLPLTAAAAADPLAALRALAQTSVTPAMAVASRRAALAELPSLGDIPTSPLALCRMVLAGLPFLAPTAPSTSSSSAPDSPNSGLQLVQQLVSPVLPGGLRPPPTCHPKIWALVQFLRRYRDRSEFHGIVFARTRQGAHYLADVLRAASVSPGSAAAFDDGQSTAGGEPLLGFIQAVHVFVGHGNQASSAAAGPVRDHALAGAERLAARGMSAAKQQKVLEEFKAPGRRLLVATTAAEEGMDIPTCEFVVRFSPAASGIQRVQARGRARKLGAIYHCIVQVGGRSLDERLHLKSAAEEEAMRNALTGLA